MHAVEVDAHRVVERRPAVGLAGPDALDEARQIGQPVPRDADFGVEVHQRDVVGLGQFLEEANGRRAGQRDVVLHAAAGVEQQAQAQVQRVGVGVAAQEMGDVLLRAVFKQREIVRLEVADEVALPVHHHHGDVDEVHFGAKPALLAQNAGGRRRNDRRAQDDRPHTPLPRGRRNRSSGG